MRLLKQVHIHQGQTDWEDEEHYIGNEETATPCFADVIILEFFIRIRRNNLLDLLLSMPQVDFVNKEGQRGIEQ